MNHVDSVVKFKKSRVKLLIAALRTLSLTLKYGNYYSPNILLYYMTIFTMLIII